MMIINIHDNLIHCNLRLLLGLQFMHAFLVVNLVPLPGAPVVWRLDDP